MQPITSTLATGLRSSANAAWAMARYHHSSHSTGIGVARSALDVAMQGTDHRVQTLARQAVLGVARAQLTWGTTAIPHWYAAAGALQRAAEVQESIDPTAAGHRFRDRLVPADADDAALHAEFPRQPTTWRSADWYEALASCARHSASLAAASDGVGARSHALRAAQVAITHLSPQFDGVAGREAVAGILELYDAVTGRTDVAAERLLRAADSFTTVASARRGVQE